MSARLPVPGSDEGQWGAILNNYLLQSHAADGSLQTDSVGTAQLQPGAVRLYNLAPELQDMLSTPGPKGEDGQDGVGLVDISIDEVTSSYVITLSDGSTRTVATPSLNLAPLEEAIASSQSTGAELTARVNALESAAVPEHSHPEYARIIVLGPDEPLPENTSDGTIVFRSS